jgi:hypothetical protein
VPFLRSWVGRSAHDCGMACRVARRRRVCSRLSHLERAPLLVPVFFASCCSPSCTGRSLITEDLRGIVWRLHESGTSSAFSSPGDQ